MFRLWFSCLIFCVAFQCFPLMAQKATVREPSDLKVELRSETGSTQFQIGEVIPLEVLLSSTTPNRYLEPCAMFRESNFGHPQCRFFTQWSIDILPADGRIDLTKFCGPQRSGGPSFEIPSHDLGTDPAKFSYTLNNRFRPPAARQINPRRNRLDRLCRSLFTEYSVARSDAKWPILYRIVAVTLHLNPGILPLCYQSMSGI
jgi:hypothetical protein